MEKLDDAQLEGSGFVFQEIREVIFNAFYLFKFNASNYSMHFINFNLEGLEIPVKVNDIPKFENLKSINVNVFELTGTTLTSIHINMNFDRPQIDILLNENHYCLITKLHFL